MPRLTTAARRLLDRARVGRLATADRRGRPHVVPLCYARSGDRLYFIVDEKPKAPGKTLKRLRNIAENPEVALVVDVWDEDWSRLEFILVHGRASLVRDRRQFNRAVGLLRRRYRQYRSMRLEPGRNPLLRIAVERMHHWRASRKILGSDRRLC